MRRDWEAYACFKVREGDTEDRDGRLIEMMMGAADSWRKEHSGKCYSGKERVQGSRKKERRDETGKNETSEFPFSPSVCVY